MQLFIYKKNLFSLTYFDFAIKAKSAHFALIFHSAQIPLRLEEFSPNYIPPKINLACFGGFLLNEYGKELSHFT